MPSWPFAKLAACPAVSPSTDDPAYAAGLDCDGDGGVIAFLTPQTFKVALKRLSFANLAGNYVDVVADSGTLSAAQLIDLSQPVTLAQTSIPSGTYPSVRAEIYYYEITVPINGGQTSQTIRVYLSDDDFPSEGNLGHHQGDITLIDGNGQELGWAGVATEWVTSALQSAPAAVLRPGSIDPETGHQRGHFGNTELWDQASFTQGDSLDIFVMDTPLGLSLGANMTPTITFAFDVVDTWFWEDFDANGSFDPCRNGTQLDACQANAEWAPLFNPPTLTID